jgi:excisionase family DNA binding protein
MTEAQGTRKRLTTDEAARLLYVDRSTIIKLVGRGELRPADKLPGRTGAYLFAPADVAKLAAKRGAA